jgi:hypothetical protein
MNDDIMCFQVPRLQREGEDAPSSLRTQAFPHEQSLSGARGAKSHEPVQSLFGASILASPALDSNSLWKM